VAGNDLGKDFGRLVRVARGERNDHVESITAGRFDQRLQSDFGEQSANGQSHGRKRPQRTLLSGIEIEEHELGFVERRNARRPDV
jgi:hypothetical protein